MARLATLICCSFLLVSESVAGPGKPPHTELAASARWQVKNANWGIIATTSVHLNGTAFGNPISLVDAMNDGTPYFYVSMMDTSMQDLAADPHATVTITEASIDCQTLQLNPEDPRCVRLSLSGVMVDVNETAEVSKATAALFARHPPMKSWPSDHSWMVKKLQIQRIWLIDFFGGATDMPIKNYTAAVPPTDLAPVNASRVPSKGKPFFPFKVSTARWLAHQARWGSIATTSIHLNGVAFANTISLVDGTEDNSTGTPYFFVSELDTSMQDLKKYPKCTLTLSEASVDCAEKKLDPEDPRCVRLSLTGTMADVSNADEVAFAKKGLFAAYPDMADWPESHDFHITKLEIERIWLIDFFGGATDIKPKDYFASHAATKLLSPVIV